MCCEAVNKKKSGETDILSTNIESKRAKIAKIVELWMLFDYFNIILSFTLEK